ncbi:hypothetical protein D9756_002842 [Leucocoprinus leucothites]|uniref:DUF5648 domain-containing protein n=1 Tax=Leucocoprinus leucothites TaxID=201217 RepID=A0A8H5GBD7_9AGAR|nr:hypothetical protein D9756_002842 [Leucoagaricus leucothites]
MHLLYSVFALHLSSVVVAITNERALPVATATNITINLNYSEGAGEIVLGSPNNCGCDDPKCRDPRCAGCDCRNPKCKDPSARTSATAKTRIARIPDARDATAQIPGARTQCARTVIATTQSAKILCAVGAIVRILIVEIRNAPLVTAAIPGVRICPTEPCSKPFPGPTTVTIPTTTTTTLTVPTTITVPTGTTTISTTTTTTVPTTTTATVPTTATTTLPSTTTTTLTTTTSFTVTTTVGTTSSEPTETPTPCGPREWSIVMRRFYHPIWRDHLLISWNTIELNDAIRQGYQEERTTLGRVWRNGNFPLYRCFYQEPVLDHFYTTNKTEFDEAVGQGCLLLFPPGIVGWIYEKQECGSVPVFRSYNEKDQDHLYTINKQEHQNATEHGYKDEGVIGFVLPP